MKSKIIISILLLSLVYFYEQHTIIQPQQEKNNTTEGLFNTIHNQMIFLDWSGSVVNFENSTALLLLFLIPVFWLVYSTYIKRRIEYLSLNYSYTSVLNSLLKQPKLWKRLFYPVVLSIVGICCIISASRPTLNIKVPQTNSDIMLVMDVSISMSADDIEPSRLGVCAEELSTFTNQLPDDARVGLIIFAGQANIMSEPTTDKNKIISILSNLTEEDLMQSTDIGNALNTAKNILIEEKENGQKAIILLTDGESTSFTYSALEAAEQSFDNNIRIYCVGVGGDQEGTLKWTDPETGEESEHPISALKSEELEEIAAAGGGEFFRAFDQEAINKIYDDIKEKTTVYKTTPYEIGYVFSVLGLVSLLVLLVSSLAFNWVYKNNI